MLTHREAADTLVICAPPFSDPQAASLGQLRAGVTRFERGPPERERVHQPCIFGTKDSAATAIVGCSELYGWGSPPRRALTAVSASPKCGFRTRGVRSDEEDTRLGVPGTLFQDERTLLLTLVREVARPSR